MIEVLVHKTGVSNHIPRDIFCLESVLNQLLFLLEFRLPTTDEMRVMRQT